MVNFVSQNANGVCDDGGDGASTSRCALGHDFTDCGSRECQSGGSGRRLTEASAVPLGSNAMCDAVLQRRGYRSCTEVGLTQEICEGIYEYDDGGMRLCLFSQSAAAAGQPACFAPGSTFRCEDHPPAPPPAGDCTWTNTFIEATEGCFRVDLADCEGQYERRDELIWRCETSDSGICMPELVGHACKLQSPADRHLEIWTSRTFASFGTRCATLDTTDAIRSRFVLSCREDAAADVPGSGRYVFVRSFHDGDALSIDSIVPYSDEPLEQQRRLFQTEETGEATEGMSEVPANNGVDPNSTAPSELLVTRMRELTRKGCWKNETGRRARMKATMLFAELDEYETNTSCTDCATGKPNTSCLMYFLVARPFLEGDVAEAQRRARRELEDHRDAHRRALEEGLDRACCKVNRETGERTCAKEYCIPAMKQKLRPHVAHVVRKLEEKGHVKLSLAQKVASDTLAPHLHPHADCRPEPASDGAEPKKKMEDQACMVESVIHHLSMAHGQSREAVDEQLSKVGQSLASLVHQAMRSAGSTSGASPWRSNPERAQQAADEKEREREKERATRVSRMLLAKDADGQSSPYGAWRRSRRRTTSKSKPTYSKSSTTRARQLTMARTPTSVSDHPKVAEAKKSFFDWAQNASGVAAKVAKLSERVNPIDGHALVNDETLVGSMQGLAGAIAASVSAQGSVVQVVGNAASTIAQLGEQRRVLSQKIRDAGTVSEGRRRLHTDERQERVAKHRPSREQRLRDIETFFNEVNRRLTPEQRRLAETHDDRGIGRMGLHLPESWATARDSGVDWHWWIHELHATADTLKGRGRDLEEHVAEHGALPSGPVHETHRTGWSMLDIQAPPSILGNKLRQLHDWLVDGHPEHTHRHDHDRLEQARVAPRRRLFAVDPDSHTTDVGVVQKLTASVIRGEDPFEAFHHLLEHDDHHVHSNVRRLGEAWLGGAIAAPVILGSVATNNLYTYENQKQTSFLQETARVLVYDVALCYLMTPDDQPTAGRDSGWGPNVELHRSTRLCFPGIPYIPAKMYSFRSAYGLQEDFSFTSIDYEEACDATAAKWLVDVLGDPNWFSFVPYGVLFRGLEGTDSIRNFVDGGAGNQTDVQRATHVVCGFSMLGGVLATALIAVIGVLALACAPIGGAIALLLYRRFTDEDTVRERREVALDKLIEAQEKSDKEEKDAVSLKGGAYQVLPS